jgi:pyruvate/2-oxoglutarate dehydrogenase complex dihydrolipoamide acyltransferase (E2) component
MLRTPSLMRKHAGTVGLTSIPVKRAGALWGIGLPIHSVAVVMGGISEQPAAVDGKVIVREVLRLTISFNHDIVDGAPAARFVTRLIEEIESPAATGAIGALG